MKKNRFVKTFLIVIILLLLNTTQVLANSENNCISEQYLESHDDKSNYINKQNYPAMEPIPIDSPEHIPKIFSIKVTDTPQEFSWKSYNGKDWTTPAKNQGPCGSCWLFSGMGALESVINIRENCAELNPDLSEQYVLSCMPMAGSCNGGNVDNCVFHFINDTSEEGNFRNGVTTEEYFSYESSFEYIPPCSDKTDDWEKYLVPILTYGESWNYYNIPEMKDTIKSLVYQKGPILVYFWVSERFITWGTYHRLPSQYYPDYDEECPYFVNHGITVVGWKDDPSIGNGGYWICKNTWGEDWGYDGFFNIEYDCLNLGGFIAWVDYDPNSYDWGPTAPAINGPTHGKALEEYDYSFTSMDPDGDDDVFYYINWDDGTVEEWIGPYKTDETIHIKHTFEENKNYNIKAKTKDINGMESSWTILEFSMTKNKLIHPFFNIIKNYNTLFLIIRQILGYEQL